MHKTAVRCNWFVSRIRLRPTCRRIDSATWPLLSSRGKLIQKACIKRLSNLRVVFLDPTSSTKSRIRRLSNWIVCTQFSGTNPRRDTRTKSSLSCTKWILIRYNWAAKKGEIAFAAAAACINNQFENRTDTGFRVKCGSSSWIQHLERFLFVFWTTTRCILIVRWCTKLDCNCSMFCCFIVGPTQIYWLLGKLVLPDSE